MIYRIKPPGHGVHIVFIKYIHTYTGEGVGGTRGALPMRGDDDGGGADDDDGDDDEPD